jgi:hypothetical protein
VARGDWTIEEDFIEPGFAVRARNGVIVAQVETMQQAIDWIEAHRYKPAAQRRSPQ